MTMDQHSPTQQVPQVLAETHFLGAPPFFEPYKYNNKLKNIPFFMVFHLEKTGVDRWWKSPISGPLFLKKNTNLRSQL